MPGKSFYRRLKEAVRGSDKDFELGVLQEQLGRDWEAVKAAGFETNKALLRAHRQAADHIAARNTKAAGKAIEDLRTRHADTQTAQTVLDPIAARGETPKYPKNSERASDQADVNWVPDAGWKQAVALEAGRDADFLKQTQESAATRRPGTEGSEDRSRDAQVKMKLDTKRAPMQLGRATFASKITVAGQSFGAPEFLGEGGFGTAARYTSPEGSSVVVKAIPTASQADLERELAINKRLAEGPADALGRENVLLMKGYVKGDDGTAYILMDEASGDLNSMKHAMNALSENGALPEEARNVLNQEMMKQGLQGTKYMHDQGVDHFDLKEPNMLIMPDGTVKVIDFGGSVADLVEGKNHPRSKLTRKHIHPTPISPR